MTCPVPPPEGPIGSPDQGAPEPGGLFSAPTKHWKGPGWNWSYDWCRFRKTSHCWFPHDIDKKATAQEGYAVWVPLDRGVCPRQKWDEQEVCPLAEPGPHVPGGSVDATVPYGEGGQHGGIPSPAYKHHS